MSELNYPIGELLVSSVLDTNSPTEQLVSSVLDTETIISEVEKRPALYNKHLKEYSDRNVKEKLWGEVCRRIIHNVLSPADSITSSATVSDNSELFDMSNQNI